MEKKLTSEFYSALFSKLKEINFAVKNVLQINETDLTEEQKEKTFGLRCLSDRKTESEENFFNEIFESWLRREIDEINENLSRAKQFKLKREVEMELGKEFHTFEELKEIYKKFEEIRRPE